MAVHQRKLFGAFPDTEEDQVRANAAPHRFASTMSIALAPVTFREACEFIALTHRHHKPPQGHRFSIGCRSEGKLVGVCIAGRPIARNADDGETLEVIRLSTDGTKNACSMLYRAAWRAALALGYKRLITYTLQDEGGSSLRGSGFKLVGNAGGGSWSRATRPRRDKHPIQEKFKWEMTA